MVNKHTLPDTMGVSLRLAVSDALAVKKMPGYKLNMYEWYVNCTEVCTVCMAGAVMVNTLGITGEDLGIFPTPSAILRLGFTTVDVGKIKAIDFMRAGNFFGAYVLFYDKDYSSKEEGILSKCSCLVNGLHTFKGERGVRASWNTYLKCAKLLDSAGI